MHTDHSAFLLSICDLVHERGPGYWKANTSILSMENVTEISTQLKKDIAVTRTKNPQDQWTYIKSRLQYYLKQISRTLSNAKKETVAHLSEVICGYEEQFPLTLQQMDYYLKSKEDLYEILDERVRSMMFRCKVKWYEEGEKSSKYFFNLEARKSAAKTSKVIIKDTNQVLTTLPEIIHEQCTFYTDLYKSDPSVDFNLTNTTNVTLSDEQHELLDQPFTQEEIRRAVFSLAKNKSPGLDGLPVEVYQALWHVIGPVYYEFLNYAYKNSVITGSTMQGVLNLLPKANKDTRYLKNLRPITLLNADYKIIEKAIAYRLQQTLPTIIDMDQAGFMQKRHAATVIRKLFDLITFCKNEKIDAFHLSLDYQKAFDRPELTSIEGALKFFYYPNRIVKWIKILYTGFTVRIQNNGHMSNEVPIEDQYIKADVRLPFSILF